jgi:hypothetical protein
VLETGKDKRLGIWYRIGWRITYVLLHVYGPPTLGGEGEPDPRSRMRADRELRRLGPPAVSRPPFPPGITGPGSLMPRFEAAAVLEGPVHVIFDVPGPKSVATKDMPTDGPAQAA